MSYCSAIVSPEELEVMVAMPSGVRKFESAPSNPRGAVGSKSAAKRVGENQQL
jgi:hypothetical protein